MKTGRKTNKHTTQNKVTKHENGKQSKQKTKHFSLQFIKGKTRLCKVLLL